MHHVLGIHLKKTDPLVGFYFSIILDATGAVSLWFVDKPFPFER